MADRPILFSAPMVRALLDGRKTQTRRALRPQPFDDGYFEGQVHLDAVCRSQWIGESDTARFTATAVGGGAIREQWVDARYAIGDRLWVRETWQVRGVYSDVVETGYRASETRGHTEYVEQIPVANAVPGKGAWPMFPKYGPSIHMPRWASRLTLTVTDVRVERLQDISEADALAEGIERISFPEQGEWGWPQRKYAELWNSINGAGAWEANPWVTAISFSVAKHNIDAEGRP